MSQLLGIPQAPGSKGAEELKKIRHVLKDWNIQVEILPIVFDTTLTNTGKWEGICKYLSNWFGNVEIFWCGCRKFMLELHIR